MDLPKEVESASLRKQRQRSQRISLRDEAERTCSRDKVEEACLKEERACPTKQRGPAPEVKRASLKKQREPSQRSSLCNGAERACPATKWRRLA